MRTSVDTDTHKEALHLFVKLEMQMQTNKPENYIRIKAR